jgi:hypothetical protein
MWGYVIVLAISVVLSIALQPTVPQTSSTDTEVKAPVAEVGIPIPVVFGTVLLQSPNVVWYGNIEYMYSSSSSGK